MPEPLVVEPEFLHVTPQLSADGRLLAYGCNRRNGVDLDVYVRSLETGEERCVLALGRLLRARRILARRPLARRSPADRAHRRQRPPHRRPRDRRRAARRAARRRTRSSTGRSGCPAAARSCSRPAPDATRSASPVSSSRPASGATCSRPTGISSCHLDRGGPHARRRGERGGLLAARAARPRDARAPARARRFPDAASSTRCRSPATAAASPTASLRRASRGASGSPTPRRARPARLTAPLGDGRRGRARRARRVERFESFDGESIPVFLFEPAGVERPPLVIEIHGGPESQRRPTWMPLVQYLVASGFAVAQPNVRGSTGYGKRFEHLDDGRQAARLRPRPRRPARMARGARPLRRRTGRCSTAARTAAT